MDDDDVWERTEEHERQEDYHEEFRARLRSLVAKWRPLNHEDNLLVKDMLNELEAILDEN